DGRISGPLLGRALAEGLAATGCAVTDVGQVPTPVLYFAAIELGIHSGVMVTGSHNPPDYNGFKIVLGGETLHGEQIRALHERIVHDRLVEGTGSIREAHIIPQYIRRITSDVRVQRRLRVVVDCGNGIAGAVAPELFRALGCEVIPLFCEVDGRFPNHHPDPSQPENLKDLIAAVAAHGADVGLAFDGDGDRLGVIAPGGKIIWPDRQLILFARDVLTRKPGAEIIYDVKCSRTLRAAVQEAGGIPVMWKTGHSFIKGRLKDPKAELAGEMSGHLFFKERWYGFDDGLYAGARLLELLARDPRPADQVFAGLPDTLNTPELHVRVAEGEPHRLVAEIAAHASFPEAETTTVDGLRLDFADGWGLVRASNTTPVLVLRFEADNMAALKRIQGQFADMIRAVKPDAVLPF
ncbi:MAG TPA: phosphomannomutase/phosphoglucomutase, partial [Acidiferrobacteraceae bacterium]|nr:phosphomannomutase/phosphoglucomutase [Acidiferrobacteraceae bacterium]